MEDPDGRQASRLQIEPAQPWRVDYRDVLKAIERLDPATRHALLLMGAGLSYQEAAEVCGCPVRTLQSRVRRGRQRLARMIE